MHLNVTLETVLCTTVVQSGAQSASLNNGDAVKCSRQFAVTMNVMSSCSQCCGVPSHLNRQTTRRYIQMLELWSKVSPLLAIVTTYAALQTLGSSAGLYKHRGGDVMELLKGLCYKPEVLGFPSRQT
jgi:hypothetical protein